jgi:hypothetical protein
VLEARKRWLSQLHRRIVARGARTVVFDLGRHGAADYEAAARALPATYARIGDAWDQSESMEPALGLFAGDGHHPNRAGSLLIASVFYAMLTGRDPRDSTYTAGLDPDDAMFLKGVALGGLPG